MKELSFPTKATQVSDLKEQWLALMLQAVDKEWVASLGACEVDRPMLEKALLIAVGMTPEYSLTGHRKAAIFFQTLAETYEANGCRLRGLTLQSLEAMPLPLPAAASSGQTMVIASPGPPQTALHLPATASSLPATAETHSRGFGKSPTIEEAPCGRKYLRMGSQTKWLGHASSHGANDWIVGVCPQGYLVFSPDCGTAKLLDIIFQEPGAVWPIHDQLLDKGNTPRTPQRRGRPADAPCSAEKSSEGAAPSTAVSVAAQVPPPSPAPVAELPKPKRGPPLRR